ncbi:MAG: sulfotransferase family protein [Trebonia sp.]
MILALWSAPRSRSTAFLRMMMQRNDFCVLHEPFSHLIDFGDTTVNGEVVRSEAELMESIRRLAQKTPVFFKDTTDFRYPGLLADARFLREVTHTFIIRNPVDAITSHYRLNSNLTCEEVGFARLYEIFEAVMNATGNVSPVVDADDLVDDPVATVREYCRVIGIPFIEEAMSWEPGMPEAWRRAPRWHESTGHSAGFERTEESGPIDISGNPALSEYLRHHLPYYEKLREYRLRP